MSIPTQAWSSSSSTRKQGICLLAIAALVLGGVANAASVAAGERSDSDECVEASSSDRLQSSSSRDRSSDNDRASRSGSRTHNHSSTEDDRSSVNSDEQEQNADDEVEEQNDGADNEENEEQNANNEVEEQDDGANNEQEQNADNEVEEQDANEEEECTEEAGGENEENNGLDILGNNCDDSNLDPHDGFQDIGEACVDIGMGEISDVDQNPSLLITDSPEQVEVDEPFEISVSTANLVRDRFLGAGDGGYYLESSFLDENGIQRGHFHTACRMLESTSAAPDAEEVPAFFEATEDGGGGAGEDEVTIEVTGMPEEGTAQCAVWAGDGSHRTPMMQRANQTPAFDAIRIEVSGGGGGNNNNNNEEEEAVEEESDSISIRSDGNSRNESLRFRR